MSRADLLKQKAIGIVPEVDDFKQALFNKGHAAEDAARSIAEGIVQDDLSPMTGMIEVHGMKLLASFDGITWHEDVVFEHKLWSDNLAAQVQRGVLEPHYQLQIEQQMMVSGAKKCLFMTSDGTEAKMKYCWIDAPTSFDHIIAIWNQFAIDLVGYQHVEPVEKPQAEAIKALPAVFVQATGMVTASNLAEFKEAATTFIAAIKTELVSDDDFANAEATVKFCKEAEGNLEATKSSVLAQMSTVDEVVRTIDHISAQLRDKRLVLDKLVKSEKEARKLDIIRVAMAEYVKHVAALEVEINPMRLTVVQPDFIGAMRNMKKLSAMHDAVNSELATRKIAADALAQDVRVKLAWCKESSAGYDFLFSDLSKLISSNGMEAFQAIVIGRIVKHKSDESVKAEAHRARIQEDEERKATAKAQAEVAAILATERAKQAAEEAEQHQEAIAKAKAENDAFDAANIEERRKAAQIAESAQAIRPPVASKVTRINPAAIPAARPSDKEIVDAVAAKFGVSFDTACDWIMGWDCPAPTER